MVCLKKRNKTYYAQIYANGKQRRVKPGIDKRHRPMAITAAYMEAITTSDIQMFIDSQVRSRGLSAKTANRYREIINRLFNWAMSQDLIRMPLDRNPAAKVQRHKEHAPTIRSLSLSQIDEQLHVLRFNPRLQTMVATQLFKLTPSTAAIALSLRCRLKSNRTTNLPEQGLSGYSPHSWQIAR